MGAPGVEYRFMFNDCLENQSTYYLCSKALPEDMINAVRSVLDTKELKDAAVNDNEVDKTKRRSKVYFLPKNQEFLDIYKTFHEIIAKCDSEFYRFSLSEFAEPIQYTVYDSEDQGYYDWHLDMGHEKARRKLSLVCQLSDPSEYEGGELQIHTGDILVPEKDKGNVVVFPSYMLHRVTPVTKGVRRSLVMWVEGPAFT